ncbi:vasodilator-stimulated phosphoprotein-like isoform X2 [Acanthaster planci]|uniref:Vasodilator-stimulated phosphoprotein-like isoform X2 n=1 Tax=Acanthaster planci TaxID=133434 RepID=A0A8B8A1U0_ACAPL|nr:vasodilator-stimulated phosphoprotein-like isoform X2 [Acanthaster planci]
MDGDNDDRRAQINASNRKKYHEKWYEYNLRSRYFDECSTPGDISKLPRLKRPRRYIHTASKGDGESSCSSARGTPHKETVPGRPARQLRTTTQPASNDKDDGSEEQYMYQKRVEKNEGVVRPSSSTLRDFNVDSKTPDQSKRMDFRKTSQSSGTVDPQPNPSPAPHADTQPPPVSLPPGVDDLPSPGLETNGTQGKEEVPSPGSGSLLGDLPSLGGPGVRGTSLSPLGGLGVEPPSALPQLKPIKKKKKKKTKSPRSAEPELEQDDNFFGGSGSPEPLSVM